MDSLEELIAKAEREGKWLLLFARYHGIWFSPSELRQENAEGRFRWGGVNWELRDPGELLREKERQLEEALKGLEDVKRRLGVE